MGATRGLPPLKNPPLKQQQTEFMEENKMPNQMQMRAKVLSYVAEQALCEKEEDPAMRFHAALDLMCRLSRELFGQAVAKELQAVVKRAAAAAAVLPTSAGSA